VSVGTFNNMSNNTSRGIQPIQVDAQAGPELSIQGPARVDLQVPDKKEGVAEFRFKANAMLGSASVTFTARRGASTARAEETISLRPAIAYRTQLTLGRLDAEKGTASPTRDLYSQERRVEAAVSAVPLVWGHALISYLGDYPYSCTEQL